VGRLAERDGGGALGTENKTSGVFLVAAAKKTPDGESSERHPPADYDLGVTERERVRVAIDGRALSRPVGGVRRYVTELWRAMGHVDPGLTGVALGGDAVSARAAGLSHHPVGSILPTNLGWSALALPRAARRLRADVFHAPAYTAPLWGARPLVLTIHDVSYARHPEWYPHSSGAIRQAFYRRSAQRADRIITDSAFSRDEIVAAYGIDPAKIAVIPLGVSADFRPGPPSRREPVILHVGDLHTRRNLRLLLEVAAELSPSIPGLTLVLVGTDRGEAASLTSLAKTLGASDVLQLAGTVRERDLCAWYQRAAVLAYPSRYEGFGLPLVEAMACGTPVVASRGSSLTEVVGDVGVLVDPDDREAWARALRDVLEQPDHAADLSRRGVARAAGFTWAATAALTAKVYRGLAVSRPTK
jgi:glycosyltransferase involved in cell wall biosynthesis